MAATVFPAPGRGLGPTGQARRDQLIAAGVLLEGICRPASSTALAPLLMPGAEAMPRIELAPRTEATDSKSRAL